MVGVRGLEPPTSASQALRAPKLRYTPIKVEMSIPIKSETTRYFIRFFTIYKRTITELSKANST